MPHVVLVCVLPVIIVGAASFALVSTTAMLDRWLDRRFSTDMHRDGLRDDFHGIPGAADGFGSTPTRDPDVVRTRTAQRMLAGIARRARWRSRADWTATLRRPSGLRGGSVTK